MKRLFLDLETSPIVAMVWGAGYDKFVNYKNILQERKIICAAWQWEDGEVEAETWNRKMDDRPLLERLVPIISQADEVIGHNIERFDLPWVRTRSVFHNLPPMPMVRLVDTLRWARKYFYLNSNKLDYIARFLGIEGKSEAFTEGEGAWRRVMQNDKKALAEMVEYCKDDVGTLLVPVWQRLRTYCPVATHEGVVNGGDKYSCPRCGSYDVQRRGTQVSAKGGQSFRLQCRDCAGWFSVSAKTKKDYDNAYATQADHTHLRGRPLPVNGSDSRVSRKSIAKGI